MDAVTAALLGAVQGLTEFLPVSSSGHLVLAKLALGNTAASAEEDVAFSVLVHLGSLIAILYVFRNDVLRIFWPRFDLQRALFLVWVSLPAIIVGFSLKAFGLLDMLNDPWFTVGGLLLTSFALWWAERPREETVHFDELSRRDFWRAGLVGLSQAIAILPGVSRSGSTIATAVTLGWQRSDAVRLSFLMGLIALTGAGVLEAKDISELDPTSGSIGFASSLIFSLIGLTCVKLIVAKRKLRWFAAYTGLLAISVALLLLVRG